MVEPSQPSFGGMEPAKKTRRSSALTKNQAEALYFINKLGQGTGYTMAPLLNLSADRCNRLLHQLWLKAAVSRRAMSSGGYVYERKR